MKNSIRFETVKIESREFKSNSVLKQISFDSYQLIKIFIFSKKRQSKKDGSNSAWPRDSVCAIVTTLQRSSKNLRNFKKEFEKIIRGPENREFPTFSDPKMFFFSQIGRIRPLDKF